VRGGVTGGDGDHTPAPGHARGLGRGRATETSVDVSRRRVGSHPAETTGTMAVMLSDLVGHHLRRE
jgi:hypothetical protein